MEKCLCKFDGQLYFCCAAKWKYQQQCKFGRQASHRMTCGYYYEHSDRCDNWDANKTARQNFESERKGLEQPNK